MNTPTHSQKPSEPAPVVGYGHSTNLPELFNKLGFSLLVSTYQAQRTLLFTSLGCKLNMLMRTFPRPMGIAVKEGEFALCTQNQIWFFRDAGIVLDGEGKQLPHDAYFVPRRSHVTGDIAAHDICWTKKGVVVVNTRFSCLATINSEDWSFEPTWKPKFISAYRAEDRCHLNGLACDDNGPKYVTAVSETDTQEGWRPKKGTTGVIIDVPSNEVLARGLAMPHSPRLHQGKLWFLESGNGELQTIDTKTGTKTTVVRLPGYLRGLTFVDQYAIVGTCKIREKSAFGGMPIESRVSELKCSIQFININTGIIEGFIEFTKGIEELFSVEVLAGLKSPHMLGFEEDVINGLFVVDPKVL